MATQQKDVKKQDGKGQRIGDLPKQRMEGYSSFYCNHVQIGQTPWDFRMQFYEIIENDEGQLALEGKASVAMSPQHTKAMLMTLMTQVEKWEEQYGEIIVPGAAPESSKKNLH